MVTLLARIVLQQLLPQVAANRMGGRMSGKLRLWAGILGTAVCASVWSAAGAAPIHWNTWSSATHGNISPDAVGVDFAITGSGSTDNLVANYPSYAPASTFADGTVVDNAPTSANGIIQLAGGNANINTITFSSPVVDPVMAIWSLGSGGATATFVFSDATPVFVAGGPSNEYGGSAISVSGNTVTGREGNGTVMFKGTFSSLSWTNPDYEWWYGFNVGIAGVSSGTPVGVPEPGPLGLLVLGLVGLGLARLKARKLS